MSDSIQQEARQILDTLAFTPFEQCHSLSREFATIPARVGLYAFRHSSEGLLYIGKAKNLRNRLRNGHKAFLWAVKYYFNWTFSCSPTFAVSPVATALTIAIVFATMLEGESQYSAFSTLTLIKAISGSFNSLGNQALS